MPTLIPRRHLIAGRSDDAVEQNQHAKPRFLDLINQLRCYQHEKK